MSKMSKDFKVKSALRCMADGGMFGGAPNRDAQLAAQERAILKPAAPAPVATPAVASVPAGGMISDGVVSRPAPAPVAPVQPQGMFSRLRKAVGMADGGMRVSLPGGAFEPLPRGDAQRQALHVPAHGSERELDELARIAARTPSTLKNPLGYVDRSDIEAAHRQRSASGPIRGMAAGGSPWDSAYAPGGSLSMQKTTPRAQPTIMLGGAAASPVAQPAAPSPAATPSPALAPPVSSTPTGPTHSIATANLQFGNGDLGTVGDWAGKPQTSATGYPILRSGGHVQGPGGPREDKVGPVMLSNNEYVLPAKTVQALGGPEELDEIVQQTNDGRKPNGVEQREEKGEKRGLRGYEFGGTVYVDANGNVRPNPVGSQVPRPMPPPAAAGVPATAPQPSPFPERDITPPKIEAEVVRNPPPAQGGGGLRGAANQISKRVNSPFMKSIGMPTAIGFAANETRKTETDDYYRRFGMDPKAAAMTTDIKTGKQIDKTPLERFGSDLVARTLGAASDLGNNLTFGLAGNAFRDKQEPVAAPAPQKNMWARDSRDVAPDSVLRKEESDAALERAKVLMNRNTPDTGGQIVQMGNTFAGGVGGDRGKELENIEAERGRQRYANDAQGMYAAIQGHIANGDLETANKLAWDSTSRALVNQGFAARQAARQAAAQPNPEDDINARFDKQAEKLSKYFRSDAAKGNLAKHLDALEGRRSLELGALRNTQASLRGQDMLSQTAAAKQAADAAIAAQRNQFEAGKMKNEQANKDRQYQLDVAKFGADEANRLRDAGTARENTAMKDVDDFAEKTFVTPDNKPDHAMAAQYRKFMASDQGAKIMSSFATDRRAAMAEGARQLKILQLKNASGGFTADQTERFSDVVGTEEPGWRHLLDAGIVPTVKAYARQRTIGGGRMVRFADGQVRYEGDLDSNNNLDTNTFINQSSLRNKK